MTPQDKIDLIDIERRAQAMRAEFTEQMFRDLRDWLRAHVPFGASHRHSH